MCGLNAIDTSIVGLHSALSLYDWRSNVTLFHGFFNTIPVWEQHDISWAMLTYTIAPVDGPLVIEDKASGPYFVTSGLREAPYLGKTLEKALANGWAPSGKQRSARHVTTSNVFVCDLDGLGDDEWYRVLKRLNDSGLTFLAYSTHSHGSAAKPGVRCRIAIPIDTKLAQPEFERVWYVVAREFFPGIALDESARHIYQQQGGWAVHPDRVNLAFRYQMDGAVVSADKALALAPASPPKVLNSYSRVVTPTAETFRMAEALDWVNPDEYSTWSKAIMALKAAAPLLGYENALLLVIQYSERGSDTATEKNDASQYAPDKFFDKAEPSMPPDVGLGVIYGMARDAAVAELKACVQKNCWTGRGREAAKYLFKHHYHTYEAIRCAYESR